MKKGIVLLLLLSCLNATSCSCSCYRRASSTSEITLTNNSGPKTLTYNDLKKIATKPYEDINLKQIYDNIDTKYTEIDPLYCLGSTLYFGYSDGTWTLKSVCDPDINLTNICDSGISLDANFKKAFKQKECYVFGDNCPLFVYCSHIDGDVYQITYRNCYGRLLSEEEHIGEVVIDYSYSFAVHTYQYFLISYTSGEKVYFKYRKYDKYSSTGEIYRVSCVSEEEYKTAEEDFNKFPNPEITYYYDKNGMIVGSIVKSKELNTIKVLDLEKRLLNTIDLNKYGVNFTKEIVLEHKIFLVGTEYSESGNLITKNYCLEIDLLTGKEKFNNNFNYLFWMDYTVRSDDKFEYTYVIYYKLEPTGRKNDTRYCAILYDDLNLENQFIYDGFLGEVFKLDDDSLFALYESSEYKITKSNKKIDLDAEDYIVDEDEIFLKRHSGEYYKVLLEDLSDLGEFYTVEDMYSEQEYSFGFISYHKTNGIHFGGTILDNGYVDDTVVPIIEERFADIYVNYGLAVYSYATATGDYIIYNCKGDVIFSDTQEIADVMDIGPRGTSDTYYFKITLKSGDTRYLAMRYFPFE